MTGKLLAVSMAAAVAAQALVVAAQSPASPAAAEAWVNATGSLAHKMSECGTLTLLTPVPQSDAIIAGVASRGLWTNTSGPTWTRIGDGDGSDRIANRASWIVFDPKNADVFWESGTYGEAGIYKTADGGKTFKRLGKVSHNDFVSVDFTDPDRQTLLAGGHEQASTVHLSADGGQNWTNIGETIPGSAGATTHPLVINALTFVVNATSMMGGTGGVFRTRDAGRSWQKVSGYGPSAAPLRASNGIIYWPANNSVLVRSTDAGATWTPVGSGLKNVTPVELPSGHIVAVGETTLMITGDAGANWVPLGPPLPYRPDGLIYSRPRKAFYMWRSECKQEVSRDAVMSFSFEVPVTGSSGAQ
jgi:photosystem II stability/assembly factor-like uncharacterized protein